MLEAKGLCEDLTAELGVNSRRLLADLEYEYSFDGKSFLQELKPRKRIDIFLFHHTASPISFDIPAPPKSPPDSPPTVNRLNSRSPTMVTGWKAPSRVKFRLPSNDEPVCSELKLISINPLMVAFASTSR